MGHVNNARYLEIVGYPGRRTGTMNKLAPPKLCLKYLWVALKHEVIQPTESHRFER
jgi:hypothetical protein